MSAHNYKPTLPICTVLASVGRLISCPILRFLPPPPHLLACTHIPFGMAGRFWAKSGTCLGHQPPLSFPPPPLVAEVQHDSDHAGAGRQRYHGGRHPEPGGDATRELLPPGAGTVPALLVPTATPCVPEPTGDKPRPLPEPRPASRLSAMRLGAPLL